jgi:hypothetical protein
MKNSENLFRQAVMCALKEQAELDTASLKTFLLSILESPLPIVNYKIGWLSEENTLIILHKILKNQNFIFCDYDYFKDHFCGREQSQNKIIWQENINELVYLFARLSEEGIIPIHNEPHKLICQNFLDKYKKPLKPRSLGTLLNKGIRIQSRIEFIDSIINKIRD